MASRVMRVPRQDTADRPFIVTWEATQACPLACRHCRASARPERDPDELSTAEAVDLMTQVAELGSPPPIFIVTGGDPFQRTDLDDLVRAGTVRYIGFSNTPAWVTAQAQTMATLRGWTPLVALQVEYSLLARTVEGELAPLARDQGMALVPWSPLKNGFLSGKYRRGGSVDDSARAAYVGGPSDDDFVVIDAVTAVADEIGAAPATVALAWLRARQGTVVPILGARRMAHLEDNLGALRGRLPDAAMRTRIEKYWDQNFET